MLKGSGFPYEAGLNKQTTGVFEKIRGIRVFDDAVLVLEFVGGTTLNEEFVAGEDVYIPIEVVKLTISSGKISMTRRNSA